LCTGLQNFGYFVTISAMEDENKLYEIGYLLNPLVPEESVGEHINEIRNSIEVAGGVLVSEDPFKMLDLAYSVCKVVASKKECVDRAYFGSIKFTATGEAIAKIKEASDKNDKIIRYLIIKTVKENSRPSPFSGSSTTTRYKAKTEEPKSKGQVSEKELDKEIEELLVGTQ